MLSGLDELWQRRIIREYDGACYDFSHDRIRDVAYAMIGPVKRRLLHRQVAKALERIYGADTDPVAEELAVHYQRAGAFKQALAYFRQAADAAKRVYAARHGGRESSEGYRDRANAVSLSGESKRSRSTVA